MNRVLCRVYSYRRCVERTLGKIAWYTRRRGGTAAACWPVFPSPLKSEISRSIDDHPQPSNLILRLHPSSTIYSTPFEFACFGCLASRSFRATLTYPPSLNSRHQSMDRKRRAKRIEIGIDRRGDCGDRVANIFKVKISMLSKLISPIFDNFI